MVHHHSVVIHFSAAVPSVCYVIDSAAVASITVDLPLVSETALLSFLSMCSVFDRCLCYIVYSQLLDCSLFLSTMTKTIRERRTDESSKYGYGIRRSTVAAENGVAGQLVSVLCYESTVLIVLRMASAFFLD